MIMKHGLKMAHLLKKTLDKRRGFSNDKYKTELGKDENGQEILAIFHYGKMLFKYNITNKKIISFDQVTNFSITNLNAILGVIELPGEFVSTFSRIGYGLVYIIEGRENKDKENKENGKNKKVGNIGDRKVGNIGDRKVGNIVDRKVGNIVDRKVGNIVDNIVDRKVKVIKVVKKIYNKDMSLIRSDLDEQLKLHNSIKSKERYRRIKEKMDTEVIVLEHIHGHRVEIEKIGDKWYIRSDIEPEEIFPVTFKQAFSAVSNLKSDIYKVKYFDRLSKKINSGLIDKWRLDIKNNCKYKFSIISNGDESWVLDSEGDIFFDKRVITKEQLIDFIRYIFGVESQFTFHGHIPDVVRNTPINVVLTDDCIKENKFNSQTLAIISEIGRDIRIVKFNAGDDDVVDHGSFMAISSFGKECILFEYDVDSLLRHGWMYYLLQRFDKKLMEEKTPERILIMKGLLDNFGNKYPIILEEDKKRLIIHNSDGEFYLSLADGTLTKRIRRDKSGGDEKRDYVYMCVGLKQEKEKYDGKYYKPFIIHKEIRYDIDFVMNEVLSKMMMLINEKYPDKLTENQIKFKGRLGLARLIRDE